MPPATKYLLIVSMDIDSDKEGLFHQVYDEEHIPLILKLPGVRSVTRLEGQSAKVRVGGQLQNIDMSDEPTFTAIYEIDSPEILETEEWQNAVEAGRWPGEVRPYTSNRRFELRKVIA
ncbi:MAG: hypothetical protein QGH73_09565 [Rhodospirillales bacterium]|jgi:hypothetical protein|nr:hypothetical protein [Rhodospirillaceae bacterium]MDP6646624.1 hypothetical protein [Rhodospirillales bacterium]MDP6841912.1 hypothetical protein [Rhodospirillales bacterium]